MVGASVGSELTTNICPVSILADKQSSGQIHANDKP